MDNFKGENSFEEAFIDHFLETHKSYRYVYGGEIHRTIEDILLKDDFKEYISTRYSSLNLQDYEIDKILANLETISDSSLYALMNKTLDVLRDGFYLDRKDLGLGQEFIEYFDYEDISNNIFKIVNQYEVKSYTNNTPSRTPDVVIFINGIPVSVVELKRIEEGADVYKAYRQMHIRYARDISHFMRYSFISVISDFANTRCGSLFAPYDHFFSWKSVDGFNYVKDGPDSFYSLIEGLYKPETLLNLIRNYVYFPDTDSKKSGELISKKVMILPKYSQYYATEALYKNVIKHMKPEGDGKGGTYFGATGCGKSYTMLFLARRLATSKTLKNPTIVLLTDRTDLDDQLSAIFESSKKFLKDQNTLQIGSRKELNEKLKGVASGGIYLLTVQKFDDEIGLLSDRANIICISDEAHRTQVNLETIYSYSEEKGVTQRYGFATYLREALPNATYVGFTGTPITETLQVFGPVVMSYKMIQSVEDGSTVRISRIEGPSSVRLDEDKIKIADKYYENQLKSGANPYQVEQSKRDMAKVRTIIANDSRLEVVVNHMIAHYEKRLEEGATVNGKAMIVCYDRKIAYEVYKKIISKRPEWNKEKKTQLDESKLTYEQLASLKPIEMIKLVATRNKDDEDDLYDLLGDDEYRKELARLFKDENSNFKIAIVVDMWMTGFDCVSLDTMYIDKPIEKHTLIQTISRVNRVFEGKNEGLIVDYIGLEKSLLEALKIYGGKGGGGIDEPTIDNTEKIYEIFKNQLSILDQIMHEFDDSMFFKGAPKEQLATVRRGAEFVQRKKEVETAFMDATLKMKKAYDLCIGDARITKDVEIKVNFYHLIRGIIYKTSGDGDDKPDAVRMNEQVKKIIDEAISALVQIEDNTPKEAQDIFSEEYLEKIDKFPYKNAKFQLLLKLLKKVIKNYGKTNMLKAKEFSARMKEIVDKYNNRDTLIIIDNDEVYEEFIDGLTEAVKKLLGEIKEDANEFKKMGITFEEKAFYDILKSIRDNKGFEYSEEKLINLSKELKKVVDNKSKYIDWLSKDDIKNSFESDIKRTLRRNGYPPITYDDVYDKVLKQVENFKENQID